MKNFRLGEIVDFVFINLVMFLIFFVWAKYLTRNLVKGLIISFLCLLLFNLIRSFFIIKKKNKIKISKSLEQDIEQYMLSLLANTQEENLKFFYNIFLSKDSLVKLNKKKKIIILNETEIVCPLFNNKNLQIEDALKVLNKINKTTQKVSFLCANCDYKDKSFLERLKGKQVKVYEKNEVFLNFLKPYGCYPKINFEYKENSRLKFKELISISFNRKRTKGYLLSGIFIFFCSFIVKYNFYYVFVSSFLFLFSVLCFMNKRSGLESKF